MTVAAGYTTPMTAAAAQLSSSALSTACLETAIVAQRECRARTRKIQCKLGVAVALECRPCGFMVLLGGRDIAHSFMAAAGRCTGMRKIIFQNIE